MMDTGHIAVIVQSRIDAGGGFQQPLSVIKLLNERNGGSFRFTFLTTIKENISVFKEHQIEMNYLDVRGSWVERILERACAQPLIYRILRRCGLDRALHLDLYRMNALDRNLSLRGVDLIYFVGPYNLAVKTQKFNYIFTLHDLCHRDHNEFPEVRCDGEYERREHEYGLGMLKATAVVVDSDISKANVARRYGVDHERIAVLPFLPSAAVSEAQNTETHIDLNERYGINGAYIYYPARFWPHKNHIYILESLRILKEKYNQTIQAVFSGGDGGTLSYILRCADEWGLRDQIKYVGFIPDADVPELYRQSKALVMPTYFGPTNIPPLEAFALGVPVLYSDLPGLRDQVEGAALLMDLKDPQTLAGHLHRLICGEQDTQELIANGRAKLAGWGREQFWEGLEGIFKMYQYKRRCWE